MDNEDEFVGLETTILIFILVKGKSKERNENVE